VSKGDAMQFVKALMSGKAVFVLRHTLLGILQREDSRAGTVEADPDFMAVVGQMTMQLYGTNPHVGQVAGTMFVLRMILEITRTAPAECHSVYMRPFPIVASMEDMCAAGGGETTTLAPEIGLFIVHDGRMIRYTLARNLFNAAGYVLPPGLDVDSSITRRNAARGPVTEAERRADAEETARMRAEPLSAEAQRQGAFASIIRGRVIMLTATDIAKVVDIPADAPDREERLADLVCKARLAVWNSGIQLEDPMISGKPYLELSRGLVDTMLRSVGTRVPTPTGVVVGLLGLGITRTTSGHRLDLVDSVIMFVIRDDSVSYESALTDVLLNTGVRMPSV
jgi:hypothetical protein